MNRLFISWNNDIDGLNFILSIFVRDSRNLLPIFLSVDRIKSFKLIGSKSILYFTRDNNEYFIEL